MSTEELTELKPMPPALYWEWRTTNAEKQLAEKNYELHKALHVNLQQRHKLAELEVRANSPRLQAAHSQVELMQKESDNMRDKIESELDIDFKDCVIGEDLIIRKLDQGENE